MIDLHCHFLPAFDDGASDFAEAAGMLQIAAADGVTKVVATPHLYWKSDEGGQELQAETCFRRFVEEFQEFRSSGKTVFPELELGGENYLTPGFLEAIGHGRCRTLGASKWMLVEIAPTLGLSALFQAADWMQQRGFRLMWAHPERCVALQKSLEVAQLAVAKKIGLQINSGSLLGEWGRSAQRAAEGLLSLGCVHVLASDGHNTRQRRPLLSDGVERAFQLLLDKAKARVLVEDNPAAVLEDRPIENLGSFRK